MKVRRIISVTPGSWTLGLFLVGAGLGVVASGAKTIKVVDLDQATVKSFNEAMSDPNVVPFRKKS